MGVNSYTNRHLCKNNGLTLEDKISSQHSYKLLIGTVSITTRQTKQMDVNHSLIYINWNLSSQDHTGKSATIRESNPGSGVLKEHYAYYYVPKSFVSRNWRMEN